VDRTKKTSFVIVDPAPGTATYWVGVLDKAGNYDSNPPSVTVTMGAIPDVTDLTATITHKSDVLLTWVLATKPPGFAEFEIRSAATNVGWAAASYLHSTKQRKLLITDPPAGTVWSWVGVKDRSGNYDANPASVYGSISAGFTLDTVPDGTTYQRMPIANMDSNRRALIDFTQSGHLNKTLDYVADGILTSPRTAVSVGLLANRPAAGVSGRLYHATDSNAGTGGTVYRDTGSAWIPVAVGSSAGVTSFTPSLAFSSSPATYGSPTGGGYFYSGSLVIFAFLIQLTANGSGTVTLNLPVMSSTVGPIYGYPINGAVIFTNYNNMNFSAAGRSLVGNVPSTSNIANLYAAGSTSGVTQLTSGMLTNTSLIEGVAIYMG
jgi:hypothetical protein